LPNILSDTENDVPVPINIDAGGGGALLAPAWNGVAVGVGNDSITTRTDRWSSLDSVKNFACKDHNPYKVIVTYELTYFFCPRLRGFSLLWGCPGTTNTSKCNVDHLMLTIRHEKSDPESRAVPHLFHEC
jgi:hypothetical protein